MRKFLIALAVAAIVTSSAPVQRIEAASGYVPKTVDMCTNDFTVHTRTGLNMNTIYQKFGFCNNGPVYQTFNLCRDWPQVRSVTGVVLNHFAQMELCGQNTGTTGPGF